MFRFYESRYLGMRKMSSSTDHRHKLDSQTRVGKCNGHCGQAPDENPHNRVALTYYKFAYLTDQTDNLAGGRSVASSLVRSRPCTCISRLKIHENLTPPWPHSLVGCMGNESTRMFFWKITAGSYEPINAQASDRLLAWCWQTRGR